MSLLAFDKDMNCVCFIKFIIVVDNNGKRVYSKYYLNNASLQSLNDEKAQREFEQRLCLTALNYNVARNEGKNATQSLLIVDIFSLDDFAIVAKISNEIAIFIGCLNDNNELLLQTVYDILESSLFPLINDSLSKKKLMDSYEKFVILIDELINEGIPMQNNPERINDIIELNDDATKTQIPNALSSTSNSYLGAMLSRTKMLFSK